MEWTEAIRKAVSYIESHITEEITMYDVAAYVNVSPFYFHKGFSILCGYSITEYIRNRRLALAGEELMSSDSACHEVWIRFPRQLCEGIYPISRMFTVGCAQR